MKENFCDSLMRVIKAASFGFLGATAIIHITSLVRPIIRESENMYLSIVNLAKSLEKHGLMGLLWFAPVVISQSYAFTWWIMRRQSRQRGL